MNIEETISIQDAAKLKGVSRQSIQTAVKQGKIKITKEFAGRKMLNRQDVEKYQPRAKKGKQE